MDHDCGSLGRDSLERARFSDASLWITVEVRSQADVNPYRATTALVDPHDFSQ